MTEYYNHGFCLTENQIKKLDNAARKGTAVAIQLGKKNLNGNMNIPLTKTQYARVQNASNGLRLTFSKKQLKEVQKKGGFLPLLGLLPAILGAVGGLAGGITSAVNSSRQTAEQARHNRQMEAKGSGFIQGKKLTSALKKFGGCSDLIGLKVGNGLYLEPYSG